MVECLLGPIRECAWRPIDLRTTVGVIPHGCEPIGAIVDLPADHDQIRPIMDLGCPIVRVGIMPHPLDHQVPAVICDLPAIGRLAADYFARRNFQHVAYVGRDPWGIAQVVFESFEQHAEQLGLVCHALRLSNRASSEEMRAYHHRRAIETEQWLAGLPKPVGVLAPAPSLGAQLCIACAAAGLEIPEQVAILSAANQLPFCQTSPIPLSAVDRNDRAVGREAVSLLRRIVQGQAPSAAPIIIPPVGVVERQSTDVLAVPNPVVARALRFIWDHLDAKTSVDDIANVVGTSRRTLERAFRSTLGCSVHTERNRKRLEYCAGLLRTTDRNIEAIAAAAGFPSASSMYRAFQKRYHMSPGDFRKQSRA